MSQEQGSRETADAVNSFHASWAWLMQSVLDHGHEVAPRGMRVKERLGVQLHVSDARRTLLVDPLRDLNYRFMVAEFLWIIGGRQDLEPLARYNSVYRRFSDDGETLAGAYGPRLLPQWDYLYRTLLGDRDSRQAVATIWTPNPGPSKDIPCTVAVQFLIRQGQLHSIWTMRSSDLWLGLPYDVYSFSMLQNALAGALEVEVGSLTMQLGSAHLYEEHWQQARTLAVGAGSPFTRGLNVTRNSQGFFVAGAYPNERLLGFAARSFCREVFDERVSVLNFTGDDPYYTLARAVRSAGKAEALEVLLGATRPR